MCNGVIEKQAVSVVKVKTILVSEVAGDSDECSRPNDLKGLRKNHEHPMIAGLRVQI
jgi:hypothetical protein